MVVETIIVDPVIYTGVNSLDCPNENLGGSSNSDYKCSHTDFLGLYLHYPQNIMTLNSLGITCWYDLIHILRKIIALVIPVELVVYSGP